MGPVVIGVRAERRIVAVQGAIGPLETGVPSR